jgi:hypothetical protein
MQRETSSSSSLSTRRPSVYEEAMEMLAGALIIYVFADMREMARQRDLDQDRSVSTAPPLHISDLEPPISLEAMVNKIQENAHALAERAIDHEDLKKRLEALHSIRLTAAANQNPSGNNSTAGNASSSGGLWSSLLNNFATTRPSSTKQILTPSSKIPSVALTNFEDENGEW